LDTRDRLKPVLLLAGVLKAVVEELFAERVAVDAEPGAGLAMHAVGTPSFFRYK
jgi:hypothetical protein